MESSRKSALNIKDTVLVPKQEDTLPMRANLREAEPNRLRKWTELGLEEKIRERRAGSPKYVLHDGPPYANGNIHLGHAVNKILKDVVVRHRTMKGLDVTYVPGWDCHGLPVEQRALRRLGDRMGSATPIEVREICADEAAKWIDVQREEFKRLLVGGQWDKPYATMAPEFEVGILQAFRAIVERGLVYRDLRPVYWDPIYRTALAEAEIEYQTRRDPSIYVAMPLVKPTAIKGLTLPPGTALVIWTTTPWTLPGNVAVALGPSIEYCLIESDPPAHVQYEKAHYIVAADLAIEFAQKVGLTNWRVVGDPFPAKPLEGADCLHPILEKFSKVILSNHVTVERTGVVHTASGHGVEDFIVCQNYGMEVVQPLDDAGRYIKGYFPEEQMSDAMRRLEGVSVLADKPQDTANYKVLEILRLTPGLLLKEETIEHEYPHSWRSRQPVLFRATEQWFMAVDRHGVRWQCMKLIEDGVRWIPDWGKNRIEGMMKSRPDWCLSRQRAWGVPIPALKSKLSGREYLDSAVIDRFIEIVAEEGTDAWFKRPVAELLPKNYKGPDGETADDVEKGADVLDVWFDSGSSHIAVCERHPGLHWPADLYLEGSDQHRGWFQTSLLVAVGARNAAPYKSVLTHGFVLDEKGEAMSKSKGNVIAPQEVIDQHGAEILRLWVATEDFRADMKASKARFEQLSELYRRVRNTLRFICGNLSDFDPLHDPIDYKKLTSLDRFALHRLAEVVDEANAAYDNFEFHRVAHLLASYSSADLGAFYLDAIKDRLYCDGRRSLRRRSSQTVLNHIAQALARLMAPILPHTADEVWEKLPAGDASEPSVHLAHLPESKEEWRDAGLAEEWRRLVKTRDAALKAIEAVRKKREEKETENKFVGNSLEAKVILHAPADSDLRALLEKHRQDLAEFFIVSDVELAAERPASPRTHSPEEESTLSLLVAKAPGTKCERCWRVLPSVGADAAWPTLCDRCAEVVKKESVESA
jgi:isoleucyl-tRNA synthetase